MSSLICIVFSSPFAFFFVGKMKFWTVFEGENFFKKKFKSVGWWCWQAGTTEKEMEIDWWGMYLDVLSGKGTHGFIYVWGLWTLCAIAGVQFLLYLPSSLFVIQLFFYVNLLTLPKTKNKNKKTTTRVKTLYLLSELNPLRTRVSSMFSNVSIIPHEISPTGVVFFFLKSFWKSNILSKP